MALTLARFSPLGTSSSTEPHGAMGTRFHLHPPHGGPWGKQLHPCEAEPRLREGSIHVSSGDAKAQVLLQQHRMRHYLFYLSSKRHLVLTLLQSSLVRRQQKKTSPCKCVPRAGLHGCLGSKLRAPRVQTCQHPPIPRGPGILLSGLQYALKQHSIN